jgi:hypothetical protein
MMFQVCPDYSGKALGFENCFTAFLCCFAGFGLALILFLIELGSKYSRYRVPFIDSYGKLDLNDEIKVDFLFETSVCNLIL